MTIRHAIRRWMYGLVLTVLFCLGLLSCEEYFRPELEDSEPVLVVEGAITTMPGPYTIKLTFSSGVFANEQQPLENARVIITEEGGIQETLSENRPGHYQTTPQGIQGSPGKSYQLSIQLQDGRQYESTYQTMPAPVLIDSVGADLIYRYWSLEEPEVPGYQFHVTTQRAENSENYLMWALEATYKYHSDFTIDYLYDNRRINPYPNPTEFMTCWRTDLINEVYTFNTAMLSEPRVEQFPLHFARADLREISDRYSLLVRQFTLTREGYTFWNNLQRQIESQESLYNTQPFQIRGNVSNIENPEEAVLGFFLVAGQSEQRVYVDRPEVLPTPFSYCAADYMSFGLIGLIHPNNWPIYIYEDDTGRRALANEECFDCRALGGTTNRPVFWED